MKCPSGLVAFPVFNIGMPYDVDHVDCLAINTSSNYHFSFVYGQELLMDSYPCGCAVVGVVLPNLPGGQLDFFVLNTFLVLLFFLFHLRSFFFLFLVFFFLFFVVGFVMWVGPTLVMC